MKTVVAGVVFAILTLIAGFLPGMTAEPGPELPITPSTASTFNS